MTPWAHAACGATLAWLSAGKQPPRWTGWLLGSVLPDVDFVLLVPWLGRPAGHRTITHAPLFQLGVAWLLRRYGFGPVFYGQLVHSLTDSMGRGHPRGVAWLWPLRWQRVDLFTPLTHWLRQHLFVLETR